LNNLIALIEQSYNPVLGFSLLQEY